MLVYEADCDHLKEWLEGQQSAAAVFSPPSVTVHALKAQIAEVEVSTSEKV